MGIARRRSKHVLKGKPDEVAHDHAQTELETIKKQMGRMRRKLVISQDETEFHLYRYLVAIWSTVPNPKWAPRARTRSAPCMAA
jgi:hypothetical protein